MENDNNIGFENQNQQQNDQPQYGAQEQQNSQPQYEAQQNAYGQNNFNGQQNMYGQNAYGMPPIDKKGKPMQNRVGM